MSARNNGETAWAGGAGNVECRPGGTLQGSHGWKAESTFDPKTFLATVGRGHTVSDLRKDEVVFRQSTAGTLPKA
jgi:hypothetical protein